ncbi:hypothetical protein, partial [Salmonella enterica]|uniref:hypothetical protein n=1 Tax=Salmonella enterica TaxID=28901 RepID=UPI0039EC8C3C
MNADQSTRFASVLSELAERDTVVLVDTPAGMLGGVTPQIRRASTHVVGVLQAEQIASRSFTRFREALETLDEAERPGVLG